MLHRQHRRPSAATTAKLIKIFDYQDFNLIFLNTAHLLTNPGQHKSSDNPVKPISKHQQAHL